MCEFELQTISYNMELELPPVVANWILARSRELCLSPDYLVSSLLVDLYLAG